VTFLQLRMTCVKSGIPGHIMQCAADHAVTDGDILLQIAGLLAKEICVFRYICVNRKTY
jgi:hypothetical protein